MFIKVLHFGSSATSVELSCPPQKETLMGKIHQELFGREELSYFGQRGGLVGPICLCRHSLFQKRWPMQLQREQAETRDQQNL